MPKEIKTNEKLVNHMVNRFLGWKLPSSFHPDGGISFEPEHSKEYMASIGKQPMRHEPYGTNLFDAEQAKEMVQYMLEGAPSQRSHDIETLIGEVEKMKYVQESYNSDWWIKQGSSHATEFTAKWHNKILDDVLSLLRSLQAK